jgi:hypothetical protein
VPAKKASPRGSSQVFSQPMPAEPGDFIVFDSPHVGSLAREGEVLEVIQGRADRQPPDPMGRTGHQSLIAPRGGTARKVRASQRA